MLEIVCGQRERFRKRAKEVEVENGNLIDALGTDGRSGHVGSWDWGTVVLVGLWECGIVGLWGC